jgi:hypothetical protein
MQHRALFDSLFFRTMFSYRHRINFILGFSTAFRAGYSIIRKISPTVFLFQNGNTCIEGKIDFEPPDHEPFYWLPASRMNLFVIWQYFPATWPTSNEMLVKKKGNDMIYCENLPAPDPCVVLNKPTKETNSITTG